MRTRFEPAQLAAPAIAEANSILRKCVHCGFCMATCPTYQLTNDERDGPRGRIYLIKEMLEAGGNAGPEVTRHLDRCLTCLSCMTTCPSGVDYLHLADIARTRIHNTAKRSLFARLLRWTLAKILPRPQRFATALKIARFAKPLTPLFRSFGFSRPLAAMLELAPLKLAPPSDLKGGERFAASGLRRARVLLFQGCAQQVLAARINEAAIRLMARHGIEVMIAADEGCCGALSLHMGREEEARGFAARNISSWYDTANKSGIDAVVITASGCGSVIRDYGHLMCRTGLSGQAARISDLAMDITGFLENIPLDDPDQPMGVKVAWHPPCSLQHGQKIKDAPAKMLSRAGYEVYLPKDSHLCCGSAGVYNILQPEIADQLLVNKQKNIGLTGADIIATANIGCMTQLAKSSKLPVVHVVELLDWATGGPKPAGLSRLAHSRS